jgi:L-aminopeptidase/D-esterase-like protein
MHLRLIAVAVTGVCLAGAPAPPLGAQAGGSNATLTAVPGIRVGHHTLTERPTGCTVVLPDGSAVAGVDVRGAAPGTRETELLDPVNVIQEVHAIVLSGGSAFGLDAATGVMQYLDERNTIFTLATGAWSGAADVSRVGALAADVIAEANVRAMREATSIPRFPAARDLRQ